MVMLYAVIMRFDSLREITASLLAETRKLAHLGITFKIGRSTLADANKRRPEGIFEAIYRDLLALTDIFFHRTACSITPKRSEKSYFPKHRELLLNHLFSTEGAYKSKKTDSNTIKFSA